MFTRVLIGYDGSSASRAALRLADAVAEPDAVLIVAHVALDGPGPDDGEHERRRIHDDDALQTADELLADRNDVELAAPSGSSVASVLHRTARELLCDLLVVGGSRHHGAGRVALGSNAEAVLHDTPCAVLVATGEEHRLVERIGVGFDGTPAAQVAVERTAALARELHAELTVLGVIDTRHPYPTFGTEGGYGDVRVRALARMTELMDAVDGPGRARRQLHEGDPVHQLVALGRESDLLVVGSRRSGPLLRLLLGSVSSAVVRRATCPVLILPAGELLPPERKVPRADV